MQVAEAHSIDMAENKYLSHGDLENKHAGYRLDQAGYLWHYWGEVLAGGTVTPQEALEGWLASHPHRAVIYDEAYKEVGIGYVFKEGTKYGHYYTVIFVVPK